MNKRIIISAAAVIALAACSEDKGAGTSVGTDSTAETLSDADIAFMNSMLDSFGSSNKAVVSDDVVTDEETTDDETTTEEETVTEEETLEIAEVTEAE